MSVSFTLEDDLDISRGDMIVRENNIPQITQDLDVIITWMNNKPLQKNSKFYLKHTSQEVKAIVTDIKYEININTLHRNLDVDNLKLNSIGRISLRTSNPLFVDRYKVNRRTGSLILIDFRTFETVGAGIII